MVSSLCSPITTATLSYSRREIIRDLEHDHFVRAEIDERINSICFCTFIEQLLGPCMSLPCVSYRSEKYHDVSCMHSTPMSISLRIHAGKATRQILECRAFILCWLLLNRSTLICPGFCSGVFAVSLCRFRNPIDDHAPAPSLEKLS